MAAWLLRRVGAALATVFLVVTVTFVLIQAAPGDPFISEDRAMDPEVAERLRRDFGIDDPLHVQYGRYLSNVARGNLGTSFSQHRPVIAVLADAIPNTVVLGVAALGLDFLLGILLGVLQAVQRGRRTDVALSGTTLFLYSVPTFWLALLLLLVFGQWLHWFPLGGVTDPVRYDSLSWIGRVADRMHHLALPALTLGVVGAAGTARFQRAALLETLGHDYVRTARAKGLSEPRVITLHALRNALLPAITLAGLSLPFLLTGAVLIESIFSWPGMGWLAASAISQRDYPVVTAAGMAAAVMVVVGSLLADVLYAWSDPRVRVHTS